MQEPFAHPVNEVSIHIDLILQQTQKLRLSSKIKVMKKICSEIKILTFVSIKSPNLNYFSLPSLLSLFCFSVWENERNQTKV